MSDAIIGPVQRRAHGDVHAAVTCMLHGQDAAAREILFTSPAPVAVAYAAVVELVTAIQTLGEVTASDPKEGWALLCQHWSGDPDTGGPGLTEPANPG